MSTGSFDNHTIGKQLFTFNGLSDCGPFKIRTRSLDDAFEAGRERCEREGSTLISVNNVGVEFNESLKNSTTDFSDIIDR
jgi:hypothetical protein